MGRLAALFYIKEKIEAMRKLTRREAKPTPIYELSYEDPEMEEFRCAENYETIAASGKCLCFHIPDVTDIPRFQPPRKYFEDSMVVRFADAVYTLRPHASSATAGEPDLTLWVFPESVRFARTHGTETAGDA